MSSVTEYLELLLKLTQKNLDILKGINDAFLTRQDHLDITVDSTKYIIPSFMSLENRINNLLENFYSLVHAPETGEAYFNFDGDSRSIEVRGYSQTPNSIKLNNVSSFNVETNNIFKDFLTPNPYIHFDVQTLPDDITSVIVKKIIPKHPDLITMFKGRLITTTTTATGETSEINIPSKQYEYKDLYKVLSIYKKDVDYIEYDRTIKLPVRKNIGTGTYAIEKILKNIIDNNLDQYITVKIRDNMKSSDYMNKLYYRAFDETIERPLQVGDELTSYNGKVKFVISHIAGNTNTMTLHVVNGEYLNLDGCNDVDEKFITETSLIKFFTPADFGTDKVVKVPLEEDKYIYVAIAPLNDRMNIRAPWGTGVMINTFILNKVGADDKFEKYYKENIKNIGDTLNEISSMTYSTVTKFNSKDFYSVTRSKPVLNIEDLLVTQINNHLNNSKTILDIRSLYSQKLKYSTELDEIQTSIDNYNRQLAETSFDDVIDTRASIQAQLSALNKRKSETVTSITKVINDIALTANNSDIPLENAKFRVRGYFNYKKFIEDYNLPVKDENIIGIHVRYRYKNQSQPQGESLSINGEFLFSDWNDMKSPLRKRHPEFNNNTGYSFVQEPDNSNFNIPSFNQIDIPITQSEQVDIKLRVLYDYGYPFINTYSEWSDVLSVQFPKELAKDVQIMSIIEENNNDIETNRFNQILISEGIPEHIRDKITDLDITYFHKPENISSGFYTKERRIVPLKDKLMLMDSSISTLLSEINGDPSSGLLVIAQIGGRTQTLSTGSPNEITVQSYNTFINNTDDSKASNESGYTIKNGKVSVVINVKLQNINTSNRMIKLYPIFPGDRTELIQKVRFSLFHHEDYCFRYGSGEDKIDEGVWLKLPSNTETPAGDEVKEDIKLQTANQFITFRINNSTTGEPYYKISEGLDEKHTNDLFIINDKQTASKHICLPERTLGAALYPYLSHSDELCIQSDSPYACTTLTPGLSISIPIIFEYNLDDESMDLISKIIAFDVRTSLYTDVLTYTIRVIAKRDNTILDKVEGTAKQLNVDTYNTVFNS